MTSEFPAPTARNAIAWANGPGANGVKFFQRRKDSLYKVQNVANRGFAAAQCGKASPFRWAILFFRGYASMGGIASSSFWMVTVRQSLTALCGGTAAGGATTQTCQRITLRSTARPGNYR